MVETDPSSSHEKCRPRWWRTRTAAMPRPRRARTRLGRAAVAMLGIVTLLSSLLPSALGQSAGELRAMAAIPSYVTAWHGGMANLIAGAGFQPAVESKTWNGLSSFHMVEIAWAGAEAAEPGVGGQRFLALLARRLADEFPYAVPYDPYIRPYLDMPEVKQVKFAPSPDHANPDRRPTLPDEVREVIRRFAEYTDRSSIGTPFDVLTQHFDMTARDAYDLLARSPSTAEAFESAAQRVDKKRLRQFLERAVISLINMYPASAPREPAFQPYRPKPGDDDPGTNLRRGQPTPPSGSGSGGSEPRVWKQETNAAAYREVLDKKTSAGARAFDILSRNPDAFGGIVAGSKVEADASLRSKIKSIRIVEDSSQQTGTLHVMLADKRTVEYGPVPLELLQAAHAIVFERTAGIEPWLPGEGIGLVGMRDPAAQCNASTGEPVLEKDNNVVLHPAIEALDVGWAAVMVDALPGPPASQVGSIPDQKTRTRLSELAREIEQRRFAAWIIVDVPMRVVLENDRLHVERIPSSKPFYEPSLRRTAFAEMRVFEKAGVRAHDTKFAERFYRMMPVLIQISEHHRQLNMLLATLGVLRLAKEHGAVDISPPTAPARKQVPRAVRVSGSSVQGIPKFKARHTYREDVQECLPREEQ